ncbi:MAG TPA: hypothetical protein PKH24_01550 [Sedimentisphaerales bacterium]|jgi:integrase|nr:hypothetical protein [Sedimentisphaerales bacterium]HNU28113.1 hypothetical protein [Sedimentisphaerales bacterium]
MPGETLRLRWRDVDWEQGRLFVRSPKTGHHAGGESRLAPLFPELRPHLLGVFEAAEPGAEFVIARRHKGGLNLRAYLLRITAEARGEVLAEAVSERAKRPANGPL